MKIAVLSSHLPSPDRAKTGGVAYVAHRQANALAQRGHNVTVFTADERPADACYQVRRVHSTRPANPFRAWLWLWQLAFRYSTQDFSGFDIIHAHGNNALIRTGGRPLVRTLHGASLAEAIHAPTWKKRLWYLSLIPAELWEASRASKVVAVSAGTGQFMQRHRSCHSQFSGQQKSSVLDSNLNHQHRHNHPAILFVGTLSGRKRGQMLLDLFQNQVRPALARCRALDGCGAQTSTLPV